MKRLFAVIPVFLFVFINACNANETPVPSGMGTAVALTQTAMMWTATPVTPSATPSPNQAVIVDALNGALLGFDPLGEAIDAKFHVADVGFDANGIPPILITMRIRVECEWIIRSSCTPERAFVILIHALENKDARKKVFEQTPTTIQYIQVDSFDHMTQIGSLAIGWQDMLSYIKGDITGDQLAARVIRFSP